MKEGMRPFIDEGGRIVGSGQIMKVTKLGAPGAKVSRPGHGTHGSAPGSVAPCAAAPGYRRRADEGEKRRPPAF